MILSIFFRMIIVRTLCTFHSNEHAATLSLSHSVPPVSFVIRPPTRGGQEVEIYSVTSITSRILYYTVKIQLAKTNPIPYHTVLRSPTPIKGENNGRRNDL